MFLKNGITKIFLYNTNLMDNFYNFKKSNFNYFLFFKI